MAIIIAVIISTIGSAAVMGKPAMFAIVVVIFITCVVISVVVVAVIGIWGISAAIGIITSHHKRIKDKDLIVGQDIELMGESSMWMWLELLSLKGLLSNDCGIIERSSR